MYFQQITYFYNSVNAELTRVQEALETKFSSKEEAKEELCRAEEHLLRQEAKIASFEAFEPSDEEVLDYEEMLYLLKSKFNLLKLGFVRVYKRLK